MTFSKVKKLVYCLDTALHMTRYKLSAGSTSVLGHRFLYYHDTDIMNAS